MVLLKANGLSRPDSLALLVPGEAPPGYLSGESGGSASLLVGLVYVRKRDQVLASQSELVDAALLCHRRQQL